MTTRVCFRLLGLLVLISSAVLFEPAWGLTPEEQRFLSGFHAVLEVSSDLCRIAPRLEAEYKRFLDSSSPGQDVSDIREAVERKPGIPLRLADGVRMAEGFAMYDSQTKTVYLSSSGVAGRLRGKDGQCPEDAGVMSLAQATIGVYIHEISHSLEHAALGEDYLATMEGEILAYARESRFLAGLKGWPGKTVNGELMRRRKLDKLVKENQAILGRLQEMKGKPPKGDDINRLQKSVERLEAIRQKMERLESKAADVDPLQLSMAEMVQIWKSGWPNFIHFMIRATSTRPSLSQREKNIVDARRFLEGGRAGLKEEKPGSLAYQMMERSVSLGEQDVRFWGDEKKVDAALKFYKRRFKEVRPAPKAAAKRRSPPPEDQIQ